MVEAGCCRPSCARLIADHGLDAATITGTGLGGRITRADVEQVIQAKASAAPAPAPGPAAEPEAAAPPAPAPAPEPAAEPASAASPPATVSASLPAVGQRDSVVPLSNIRKRTAEHMG